MARAKPKRRRSSAATTEGGTPPARTRTPKWIPRLGIGLIVGGAVVVAGGYLAPLGLGNLHLVPGFALMVVGLLVLSRAR